ncbi:MAG: hypothetical protein JXA89_22100, partial [Anaerolineae bacterium]|nr:hypothetical protein [Anaerolineae bacterium]
SEHPLMQVDIDWQSTVTTLCGEVNESMNGQNVVVAGIIDWIRPHLTKKGDPMAFVHIEDIQGGIEVVVFPRSYAAYRDLLQEDKIIIVRGKVDAERGNPKILCDSITDRVQVARPTEETKKASAPVQEKARPVREKAQQVRVTIRRTENAESDVGLVQRVCAQLQEHPGNDRFTFWIVNGHYRVKIVYPQRAAYTPELAHALRSMLGQNALQVA